jgi:hypothetical protein
MYSSREGTEEVEKLRQELLSCDFYNQFEASVEANLYQSHVELPKTSRLTLYGGFDTTFEAISRKARKLANSSRQLLRSTNHF